MKYITVILLALGIVFATGGLVAQDKPAGAPVPAKDIKSKMEKAAKEMTISGEVVDVSCYLAHGPKGMGNDHKSCAEACAKNGSPLGILDKTGKLYVSVLPDDHSTGPNAKLIDHVAHQVNVTGIVRSKGGVNGIMITKVEMPAAEKQE
ncbi:MAG TPA: hypothetical protein VGR15_00935 [Bacteroidota bacterium]|jgi:hypothetical protein|nr:hypothetical protein [Bacteroidota bacterium]